MSEKKDSCMVCIYYAACSRNEDSFKIIEPHCYTSSKTNFYKMLPKVCRIYKKKEVAGNE